MPPTDMTVFRSFRDPVLTVWPYLSRPELLERWLGPAEIHLALDGEFHASLWNGDRVRGRVLTVAPPSRLELAWRAAGADAERRVTMTLEHQGPGCRIRVEQEDPGSDVERAHFFVWWREALDALRGAVDGCDAHHWGDTLPIVVRAPLAREADDIWPLLSTSNGLEKWLAGAQRFDGVPGGSFRFVSRYQGREVIEEGRIEAIEPAHLVALSWEWVGQGWPVPTCVELRLEPDPSGAALLVRHSGFEALEPLPRLAARTNYAAAWRDVTEDLRRLVAPGPTG